MEVMEAIRTKRATRDYAVQPIPEQVVREILNAGRLSQSAKNLQPWVFLAIRDRDRLRKLASAGGFSDHLGEAALGVLILTPDPAERFQILFDAGQASAYMQLAAWQYGIGSCPVTSYNREGARSLLNIPADLHIRIALAFGYPSPHGQMPRGHRRGRRTFEEVVRWESW